MIRIENLNYKYFKSNIYALQNINVEFNENSSYAIIGENGSGKSTLTKLILKILKLDEGNIFIDNKNIKKYTKYKIGQTIGYLFQNPDMQIFASTVYEELAFPFKLDKVKNYENKIEEILKDFNLWQYKDVPPYKLSKGERQKLAIATILVRDTKYLILDEPTSSLDKQSIAQLKNILNNLKDKKCIIVITHDIDFCNNLCDEFIKFKEGKIEKS